MDKQRGTFRLTDDVASLSIDTVARWLGEEAYWSRGRSREAVRTSIENSNFYGVVDDQGEMIACARVVTDRVTIAWICDVFVEETHRGLGIGSWMVGELVDAWTAAGVMRCLLATRDAHGVYAKVGFVPVVPGRFMEIDRRPPFS